MSDEPTKHPSRWNSAEWEAFDGKTEAGNLTATAVAMQSGPTPHDLMVSRVARLIAKREYGPEHIGYESRHREAAVEYVNAVMSVWLSINPPGTP